MHRSPGIEAARHAGEPAQRARVPNPHPFDLVRTHPAVADGKTGAGGADVSATAAFEATLADFLPRFLERRALGDERGGPGAGDARSVGISDSVHQAG